MYGNDSALIAEIPHLRRYARALVRETDLADDLVQSSLERALNRFHLWKPDRRLRPWLFAIMHNLYVDMVRRRPARATVPLEDAGTPAAPAINPGERLHVQAVLAEIDRLPQDQRDALVLVGIDELSYAEAAQVLGVAVGTLMSRLHRARAKLRERLGMVECRPAIRRVK